MLPFQYYIELLYWLIFYKPYRFLCVYQVKNNDTQWMPEPTLSEITFYGVPSEPSSVSADGATLPADSVAYEPSTGLLTVQAQLDMATDHRVQLHL